MLRYAISWIYSDIQSEEIELKNKLNNSLTEDYVLVSPDRKQVEIKELSPLKFEPDKTIKEESSCIRQKVEEIALDTKNYVLEASRELIRLLNNMPCI